MDKSLCTEKPFGLFNKAEAHISIVISLFTSENHREDDEPNKGICLHATQAVEKLLKGFIIYNNYKVRKIYNLDCLLETAKKIDPSFSDIANECLLLNGFTAVYHYCYRQPFTKKESIQIVKALKKISQFPPINAMRDLFDMVSGYNKMSDNEWEF